MTTVIHTHNLTKLYDSGRGCKNITLEIRSGQVFGFLGPNGAGKSTFVKMLVGLVRPTSGEAQLFGRPLEHLDIRRQIGYLPEQFQYQDWMTAEEVLRFHSKLSKADSTFAEKRIRKVLHDVGLEGRSHERVRHYSKGMQQRLGLACALLLDPQLLFLDEPASALDPSGRHEIRQLLAQMSQEGKTVFLNTHLLEDVESLCDEVALLQNGQLQQIGKVTEILRPDSMWEFHVGGWMPELLHSLQTQSGNLLQVVSAHTDGSALLHAAVANREQAGWLNVLLIESGLTIYQMHPLKSRLEQWYLETTANERGNRR